MKLAVAWTVGLVLLVALLEIVTCQRESTCSNTFCPRGRMCNEVSGGGTICDCPSTCPPNYDPVCSVYGIQFSNRCYLHKFACERMNINIAVNNQGPCDDSVFSDSRVRRCTENRLLQFPNRYLDWLMIARKQKLNPKVRLVLDIRGDQLDANTVQQILEWEFRVIDSNGNGQLDDSETQEVERELLSIDEGCVRGFLKSCDMNSDNGISLREWFQCFPKGRAGGEAIGSFRRNL